jgi:uncharacterized protein
VMRIVIAAFLLLCVPIYGCKSLPGIAGSGAETLDVIPLSVSKSNGPTVHLRVEVARSSEQQKRGLMFRESLADDAGMLFPYDTPQTVSFWMKNTVIPLDMIFIRADGTIARIAAETEPYTLEAEKSGEPVAAVLEIAGGQAAALGIAEGDKAAW